MANARISAFFGTEAMTLETPERMSTMTKPKLTEDQKNPLDSMVSCKFGDDTCPCNDGDQCHYEGNTPMVPPGVSSPIAYMRGMNECNRHYRLVTAGKRKEKDVPPHPFRYLKTDSPNVKNEWHDYNFGWFNAVPI